MQHLIECFKQFEFFRFTGKKSSASSGFILIPPENIVL